MRDGSVLTAPLEEFRHKIDIDLLGPWLGAKYAVPQMMKRGGGSIINASSITALRALPNRAAYSAAKGGLSALTRQMALDLAPHRIRVNAVAPGSVLTERIVERRKTNEADPGMLSRHLLGLIDPIDVAHAVLYFASDESRRTTGQILAVDSGFSIT
jgi:NAD(P)-dependent dehydrogenase (short-subunit alcohol dehydrogenase family)